MKSFELLMGLINLSTKLKELGVDISPIQNSIDYINYLEQQLYKAREFAENIKATNNSELLLEKIIFPTSIGGIYFIQSMNGFIKIGQAVNFSRRLPTINGSSPVPIWPIGYITTNDFSLEKQLHKRFQYLRIDNNKEWFRPGDELVMFIKDNARAEAK